MIVDAGARRLPQIHAEVEPLRLHGFCQDPDGEIHKRKEFLSFCGKKIGQTAQVTEFYHSFFSGLAVQWPWRLVAPTGPLPMGSPARRAAQLNPIDALRYE